MDDVRVSVKRSNEDYMKIIIEDTLTGGSHTYRKTRLSFAEEHLHAPLEFWKMFIWIDETKINKFRSDGKRFGENQSSLEKIKKFRKSTEHYFISTIM